jgi:DNA-directed RNA polymerase specialized sigma24 family protein
VTEQEPLKKWTRLNGDERQKFQERVEVMYTDDGMSIRDIARETGRSYGSIHNALLEAGVRMRPRGNPTRT